MTQNLKGKFISEASLLKIVKEANTPKFRSYVLGFLKILTVRIAFRHI